MSRSLVRRRWASFALPAAVLALACRPAVDPPGIPLYPNAQTTKLPRTQIAEVFGPIVKIDGNDVIDWGRPYDLLPGCHLVELERHVKVNGMVVRRPGSFGPEPVFIYALRMKAGARYIIQQAYCAGMPFSVGTCPSAREEQPGGAVTDLTPVSFGQDILACRAWAATTLGR